MGFFALNTPDEKQWDCECCRIRHTHNRSVHDIRTLPDVPDSFVQTMDWNPNCNCGMQEALHAHNKGIIDLDDSTEEMFKHAVVNEKVQNAIEKDIHPANVTIKI